MYPVNHFQWMQLMIIMVHFFSQPIDWTISQKLDPHAFNNWQMTIALDRNNHMMFWSEKNRKWILAFGNGCLIKWTEMEKDLAKKIQPLLYICSRIANNQVVIVDTIDTLRTNEQKYLFLFYYEMSAVLCSSSIFILISAKKKIKNEWNA